MKKKLILTISIIIIVALIGGIILSKKAKENTTDDQDIKHTANIKELDLTKQMKTELNKISHNNYLHFSDKIFGAVRSQSMLWCSLLWCEFSNVTTVPEGCTITVEKLFK